MHTGGVLPNIQASLIPQKSQLRKSAAAQEEGEGETKKKSTKGKKAKKVVADEDGKDERDKEENDGGQVQESMQL
ncbi:hypothetical protein JCM8547_008021 [Rhodosporidiobolus lusitaniae]